MAATSPITSIWTPTSKRLCCLWCHLVVPAGCRIATCRPLIAPPSCPLVYQLVVALPLTVLSLHCPLVILSCQLVVALPLNILSLCHPLVNSSHQLALDAPPSRRLFVSLCCLLLSRRASWLSCIISCCPLVAPPSRPLIVLAGCCVACPCATLSSSRRSPLPMPSNAVERHRHRRH